MGILQARILEWVAMPFSRGTSQLRNQTRVSCIPGRFFTSWATLIQPSNFTPRNLLKRIKICSHKDLYVNIFNLFFYYWFIYFVALGLSFIATQGFSSNGKQPCGMQNLLRPEIEPVSLYWQADSLPLNHPGSPLFIAALFINMLLNCGFGEDSWESLGLQGDPTNQS